MTEAQMREVVSAAFVAGWAVAAPGVPFALENEAIALPQTGNFALLTVTPTTSDQMTVGRPGTRRVQRNGWIVVKLWGPADTGAAGMAALVDAVRQIFEMVDIAPAVAGDQPITTFAANTQPVGTDGRWYMMLVRTPCWWTETK